MGKKSEPKGSKDAQKAFEQIGAISAPQAEKQYAMAEERQDYDQEQWRKNREQQSAILDQQLDYAGGQWDKYGELYDPIERSYLEDVAGYDTEERRTTESAKAQAEVASQTEAARANALRRLESYGIDPSQTRNAALDSGIRIEEAKAKALAATGARNRVEERGMDLKRDAIPMGAATAASAQEASDIDYGMDTGEMLAAGNQAIGNWGGAAGSQATTAQSQKANEGSVFGDVLGAGATAAGIWAGMGAPGIAEGGEIQGPGGPKDDAIPARLSDGEFVIPEEVVRRKGTEFFDKLIEKVRTDNAEREQNAQVTAEAMATPPPEAIPPEGMPNPGMKDGGEISALPMMNYPPPPTVAMGAY